MKDYYLVATREYFSEKLLKRIDSCIAYSLYGFVYMNSHPNPLVYVIFKTKNNDIIMDPICDKLICDSKELDENELQSFCFPNRIFTNYDDYKKSVEYKVMKKLYSKVRIKKVFKIISYLIVYPIAFIGVFLVSIASFINTGEFSFGDIYEEIFG